MSRIKSWQCPQCPQYSSRHWNLVLILEDYIEELVSQLIKETLVGAETSFSNLDGTHIDKDFFRVPTILIVVL